MQTGTEVDAVVYVCDFCGTEAPARVVRPRGDSFRQAIQPLGWFSLKGRYGQEGPSPLLRADLCSTTCGCRQLSEWADDE